MATRARLRSAPLLVWLVAACGASSTPPEPAETEPPETAQAVASPESVPDRPVPTPAAGPEKGPCEIYLALYERCEPLLQVEIQNGNRRSFRAEKGWLEYMGTTPEAPGLPAACSSMLAELEKACP